MMTRQSHQSSDGRQLFEQQFKQPRLRMTACWRFIEFAAGGFRVNLSLRLLLDIPHGKGLKIRLQGGQNFFQRLVPAFDQSFRCPAG
jgi:hypothetical protein